MFLTNKQIQKYMFILVVIKKNGRTLKNVYYKNDKVGRKKKHTHKFRTIPNYTTHTHILTHTHSDCRTYKELQSMFLWLGLWVKYQELGESIARFRYIIFDFYLLRLRFKCCL